MFAFWEYHAGMQAAARLSSWLNGACLSSVESLYTHFKGPSSVFRRKLPLCYLDVSPPFNPIPSFYRASSSLFLISSNLGWQIQSMLKEIGTYLTCFLSHYIAYPAHRKLQIPKIFVIISLRCKLQKAKLAGTAGRSVFFFLLNTHMGGRTTTFYLYLTHTSALMVCLETCR